MLIDNERSFFENKICGIDSILLPTTKKYETLEDPFSPLSPLSIPSQLSPPHQPSRYTINVMENSWVHKFKDWGSKVDPLTLPHPLTPSLSHPAHGLKGPQVLGQRPPPPRLSMLREGREDRQGSFLLDPLTPL